MRTEKDLIVLEKNDSLFRYDIGINLPEEWSTGYHSKEYTYPGNVSQGAGLVKNKINALFFYSNEKTAKYVLEAAKTKLTLPPKTEATITNTTIQTDIPLLDLSTDIVRCSSLLGVLHELGIDVLSNSFINFSRKERPPFSTIKKDFDDLFSADLRVKLNAVNHIDDFFFGLLPLLGQLLTDFDNGFVFREMLLTRGYEGYVFNEEPSSPTYCLFSPEKLSRPYHQTVQ